MTREQIRATLDGLEHLSQSTDLGGLADVGRDALTLLRDLAEDTLTEQRLLEVLIDLDHERKAVARGE